MPRAAAGRQGLTRTAARRALRGRWTGRVRISRGTRVASLLGVGSNTTASGLNEALRFDQQRLEINLRHVQHCLSTEGASATCATWLRFYQELGAHIEAEDVLLPSFADIDPEEAAALEREHERIRSLAETFTEDFVRGTAASRPLERFAELLAEHGRREESNFYPWAEYGVGEVESRAVIERIHRAGVDRPHQEYLP